MIVKFENFESKSDDLRENMLFLFHGPNHGKIEDCTNLIINLKKEKNDMELINLHSEELKKGELSKVFNENRSPNLFGNKIFYWGVAGGRIKQFNFLICNFKK